MLDYSFNVFVIIYNLHFFFVIIYLEEDLKKKKKKKLDIGFTNLSMGKINNSFKIFRNKPNIIISHF